jgi:hypothetical protein
MTPFTVPETIKAADKLDFGVGALDRILKAAKDTKLISFNPIIDIPMEIEKPKAVRLHKGMKVMMGGNPAVVYHYSHDEIEIQWPNGAIQTFPRATWKRAITPFVAPKAVEAPKVTETPKVEQLTVGTKVEVLREHDELPAGGIGTITYVSKERVVVHFVGEFAARWHGKLHEDRYADRYETDCWNYENYPYYFKILPKDYPMPPDANQILLEKYPVGTIVKTTYNFGIPVGSIGKIVSIQSGIASIQFYGDVTEDYHDYLHYDPTGAFPDCYDLRMGRMERYVEIMPADTKMPEKTPEAELEEKYKKMGMQLITKDRKKYYILPMVFCPKLLKRNDGNLYEIPTFIQDKLRTDIMCVMQKGGSRVSLATQDMESGFANFHGGGRSPYDTFCEGTFDSYVTGPDSAIDARDRAQKMLEVIGYESPPRDTVQGVSMEEIRMWAIVPAKNRAFDTDKSAGYRIATDEQRAAAIEELRKKFEYIKKVIESADKEKETANA